MTMSHLHNSHTYTSLKDVLDTSSPIGSKQHLKPFHSLPDIHHVRMKNPLVEKAAKAYLAVGSNIQQAHQPSVQPSGMFSSILKTIQFPLGVTHMSFHKVWGGALVWLRQMCIKCWRSQIIQHCGYGWRSYTMWHHDGCRLMMKVAWSKRMKWCSLFYSFNWLFTWSFFVLFYDEDNAYGWWLFSGRMWYFIFSLSLDEEEVSCILEKLVIWVNPCRWSSWHGCNHLLRKHNVFVLFLLV